MAYHGQRLLPESVAAVNERTSRVGLLPLVDTTGLAGKPLCFILKGEFDYVYYVDDFVAAAKAVRHINSPEYYSLSDKHALLTMTRLVPIYTTHVSDDSRRILQHSVGEYGCLVNIPRLISCGVIRQDNVHTFDSLGQSLDDSPHYFTKPVVAIVPVWKRVRTGKKFRVNMPATSAQGFVGFHIDDMTTPSHIARSMYMYYTKLAKRVAKHIMRLSVRPILIEDTEYSQYKEDLLIELILNIKHGMCLHAMGCVITEDADLTLRNMQFMYAVLHGVVYNPRDDTPRQVSQGMLSGCGMMFNCVPHRGFTHALPVKWFGYGLLNKSKLYSTAPGVTERDKHVFTDVNFTHLLESLQSEGITATSSKEEVESAVYHGSRPSITETYSTILSRGCMLSAMPSLVLTPHTEIDRPRKYYN
jgi:hypothetical protein